MAGARAGHRAAPAAAGLEREALDTGSNASPSASSSSGSTAWSRERRSKTRLASTGRPSSPVEFRRRDRRTAYGRRRRTRDPRRTGTYSGSSEPSKPPPRALGSAGTSCSAGGFAFRALACDPFPGPFRSEPSSGGDPTPFVGYEIQNRHQSDRANPRLSAVGGAKPTVAIRTDGLCPKFDRL